MLLAPLAQESGGLTVQPYWVLVAIVQFALLFFLLQRFLWGPVMKTLQVRADRIREGLEAADAAKAERERMTAEVERLLADARREAAALSDRATKAAEAAAAEMRAEAKTEADRIRERGRADAQHLHDQALAQLRGEVASMVVAAASRVLGAEIDPAKHRTLIERSIDDAGTEMGRLS
ncbi:MAG: F0F1 ATP synthase subunit B [Chloroflexota bacterium]|nr:F0F1 ATP synthase subunit B [Chloroflexota bacterium]